MKLLTIICSFFLLTSCLKENHTVRVKNHLSNSIDQMKVGTVNFGTVAAAALTEYHAIETGDFTVSGRSTGGTVILGSGKISGKGSHKWTVYVSISGELSIAKD